MKASRLGATRGLRQLKKDQRGQSAVEFVLVMPLMVLVFLIIVSIFMLCLDLLMARYGAFVGARAVLSGEQLWEDGPRAIGEMLYNVDRRSGDPVKVSKVCGGGGVDLRVRIREFFTDDTIFGGAGSMVLRRSCCMGPPPFQPSGDNMQWVAWRDVKARPLNFPKDR